jgi:DNA-binding NarL/FixJ family response regulator
MVVDDAGNVLEANALARGLLDAKGRSLLDELGAATATEHEHAAWSFKAVTTGERGRAFLFIQRSTAARQESSLPGSLSSAAATQWKLTSRQREILTCVVAGMANRTIAALHGVAVRTVEAHLTAIFEKARVESRAALIGRVFTLC